MMKTSLTLSWRRPLSYRNLSIDLLRKSMDWLLFDNSLRHERVKRSITVFQYFLIFSEGLVFLGEHGVFYILGDIQAS